MKKISMITILLLATGTLFAENHLVPLESQSVHVPKGFDSNDKVEIVVTGLLPSTCYRRPTAEAKIIDKNVFVDVKATKV